MKPRLHAVAASILACLLLVWLPACGTTRAMHEPTPSYVTVIEPDGSAMVMVMTTAQVGLGEVDRNAGEFHCASFNCPGDGWVQLVILGFYALGYACYFLGYGIYWCIDSCIEYWSDDCGGE